MDMTLEFVLRIFVAALLGGAIGLEREYRAKEAGLRTHFLVALGSALFMVVSAYGFEGAMHTPEHRWDVSRVAAQVVSGIGFIGAGTVLRNGPMVFGLTTAATLWIAASIGMACGAGMYGLAVISSLLALAVLTLIRIFEKNVLNRCAKNRRRLKINLHCNNDRVDNIRDYMVSNFKSVDALKMHKLIENPNMTKFSMVVEVVSKRPVQYIYDKLGVLEGVESVSIDTVNNER